MENSAIKFPLYAKLAQIVLGIFIFFYVLYIGQDVLIPIVFSLLIAVLLNPVVSFFQRLKINRMIAILISILIGFVLTVGILYFIGSQLGVFFDSLGELKNKLGLMVKDILYFVHEKFNIDQRQIDEWFNKTKSDGLNNALPIVHSTISTVGEIFFLLFLVPVYVFMFLFYKTLLLNFISQLFKSHDHPKVAEVLGETRTLVQSYLVGLLVECAIVAVLNSASLLIIGIDYAILLGVIGALLNIIPYIGGVVAIALPMLIAFATVSPSAALMVFIAYIIVQFIDNNIIVPRIVASRVKINALMSIIVVLIGGALWGISGMFLSIPITAIFKVIFDRIGPLKPFGYLLGDDVPPSEKLLLKFKGIKKKK